jgi:hypothetical protein
VHATNSFYGHDQVLARYVGLGDVAPILGVVQHGWNLLDGGSVERDLPEGTRRLVWSRRVAQRGWAMGSRGHLAIGAVWIYLLDSRFREQAAPSPADESVLVMPFHGTRKQAVRGDHDSYAERVAQVEAGRPVTVSLYGHEFEDPDIRAPYEQRGFRVITLGDRRSDDRSVNAETFLDRCLEVVLAHSRIVSNRLSTALIYGASVGRSIGVYGDPMELVDEDPAYGGRARMLREWPAIHTEHVDSLVAQDFAHEELGFGHRLGARELRSALGWA